MTGKVSTNKSHSGKIQITPTLTSKTSSGGSTDHNRLFNREAADQHPIQAITDLEKILDSKLDSSTALPLINDATKNKARGLFFDAMSELDLKPYWYLTSEIDPITRMGTKSSIISGPYDLGMGGGSGGGGSSITELKLTDIDPKTGQSMWPAAVSVGNKCDLKIFWSSLKGGQPSGKGTLYFYVNDNLISKKVVDQGYVTVEAGDFLVSGENVIQFKIVDMYSANTVLIGSINGVTLSLESTFNYKLPYTGTINYTYIPYGDVDKKVYFIIDGKEYGTQLVKSTGESQTFQINNLKHGSHTLEVYFTARINGVNVKSNILYYDLIYYSSGNTTPIIASDFRSLEQEQYIPFNIPYRVYISGKNLFDIELFVDEEKVQQLTVDTSVQYWEYKNDVPGNYTLTIKCGDTTKSFDIHISQSKINILPVESDLALSLSAQGRTNSEELSKRAKWEDVEHNISCELSNFNWSSNGWVKDSDGNTVLRLSGDARVKIPYLPFENDFKNRGKTIELEIATSGVRNYSSTIISCLDQTRSEFYEARTVFVNEEFRSSVFTTSLDNTKISSKITTLGDHIFNYTANGWMYNLEIVNLEDFGISLKELIVDPENTSDSFVEIGDNIIITYSLAARGFYVTPQIAAFRSQQSSISTQYKEDEHIRLTFVVEKNTDNRIIWMYINGIASGAMQYPVDDNFRQLGPNIIELGSNDANIDVYNIRIYDNSLSSKQVVSNWIADTQNPILKAERYYRNDNYNDKNEIVISKLPSDLPYIIWDINPLPQFKGDKRLGNGRFVDPTNSERNFTVTDAEYNVQGTSSSVYPTKNIRMRMRSKNGPGYSWYNDNKDLIDEFAITYPDGIGANYFTFKVDYASSEGANNVELTKLYNDACKALNILTPPQYLDSRVRVGIDGFPVVAFHKNEDGNEVFCTKANFNNDKANEDVYGFADGDESWEVTNNSADETKFKLEATVDNFSNGFEIRFPDKDGYNDMSKLGPMTAWVASTNRETATNEELAEPITYSYEETVVGENGTASTIKREITFTHDTPEYRLTKFKVELPDWFSVDSTLFYYVFTHLYLMIDSRAKNAFPTYFASRQAGDGGNRWFWLPYDMDTAIGIDNKGKLSFDYYLEDSDKLDGADVFNGQDSVMWTNVRDGMAGEISEMYAKMRLSGLISYEETERRFREHQRKWSENLVNEDSKTKYIGPLKQGDNYLEMLQGLKDQQRKWWLYNRFKYMDSKHVAGDAIKDFIQFRAYVDSGQEKPSITITPYADIYATVSYANGRVVAKRAKRNEPIIIENPFSTSEKENDQETYIYSASQLKSIGDISGFHPDTVKIGNAVKLQELKVGDSDPNYQNPYLKELTVGANVLLKSLDARNCINLGTGVTTSPDLSLCTNIEEIYFSGTQIKGIVLPDGGNIKTLHLPKTLTNLTLRNQPMLTNLKLEGTEFIEKLWLENIPSTSIKSEEMVEQMKDNTEVRLIGINETYNSYDEIKHFYDLLDTKKGVTFDGETVDKAQVTGTINIEIINYADKVKLEERYPEIKINAKTILCSLVFKNEGTIFNTKVVPAESSVTVEEIGIPTKDSTIQYYYIFNSWDKSLENIKTDIIYNAVYDEFVQQYKVKFNTQSSVIEVDPKEITLYYGDTIPTYNEDGTEFVKISNIPEQVYFLGWIRKDSLEPWGSFNENIWEFGETTITGPIELLAKWDDQGAPHINVTRLSAYKFNIDAEDNVGINAWSVVKDTATEPTEWEILEEATALFNIDYTVDGPGVYNIWVKDAQNNTYTTSITVYSFNKIISEDPLNPNTFITMDIRENDQSGEILDFDYAIAGTTLYLDCWIDDHYENKEVYIDGEIVEDNFTYKILKNTTFELYCTPCIYSVEFKSDRGIIPESQQIVYLHKAVHPNPQADNTYIIKDWWILDATGHRVRPFDFENELIIESIVLEANWIEYHLPSVLKITTAENNQEVILNLTLRYPSGGSGSVNGGSIRVEWDCPHGANTDETDLFEESSWQVYESKTNFISLSHTYETPGEYILKVASINTPYYFGAGIASGINSGKNMAILPIDILKDIEFAWDTPYPNIEAFKGAIGLESVALTQYMINLENGTFDSCTNLKRVYLPNNFYSLGDNVFSNCTNLEVIGTNALDMSASKSILPDSLSFVGRGCFSNCASLTEIDFTTLKEAPTLNPAIFSSCINIEKILLHKDTTIIPDYFLNSCTKLSSIDIVETISHIGENAFTNCTNLSKVIIRNPNLTIGKQCFAKCRLLKTAGPIGTLDSDSLVVDLEFAWDKMIPDYAFSAEYGADSWQEIYLPNNIESIGYQAFINCDKVKSSCFDLGKLTNLRIISGKAFERSNLRTLVIPSTVEIIGHNAFAYCLDLKEVYLKTISVDEIFENDKSSKPTIPNDSWFYYCTKPPIIYISGKYYGQYDDPTIHLKNNYGSYWNYITNTEIAIVEQSSDF